MNYSNQIVKALENVPSHISVIVLSDINKRVSDWLASGGDPDAPYIVQQVRYAEAIGQKYGTKKD